MTVNTILVAVLGFIILAEVCFLIYAVIESHRDGVSRYKQHKRDIGDGMAVVSTETNRAGDGR